MDDAEFNNPASPVFRHPVLQEARLLFGAYYGTAIADDETLMDTLVMAYTTLTKGMTIPRELVSADNRSDLEYACDEVERRFMQARDRVQNCATFQKLVKSDQKRIAAILFEVISCDGVGRRDDESR